MKKLFFLLLIASMTLLSFGQLRHTRFTLTVGTVDTMYVVSAFTGNQSTCMLSFNGIGLSADDAVIHLGERPHPDSAIFNAYDNPDLPYTLSDTTVSFKMARVEFPYMVIKLSPGSCAYGETIDMYMTTDRIIKRLPGLTTRIVGKASTTGIREMIDLTGGSGGSSGAAGGGGALTGVSSYSNATDDFTVITNADTKTVTVTGAPYTVEYKHIAAGSGKVWNVSTGAVSDLSTSQATVSAGVITFNGQSSNFTSNDSVVLFLIMPTKAYDIAQNVNNVVVRNPNYAHYTDPEHIIDEVNLAEAGGGNGDAGAGDLYYYYIDMQSFKGFSVTFLTTTAAANDFTIDLYGTNNSDATISGDASIDLDDDAWTDLSGYLGDVAQLTVAVSQTKQVDFWGVFDEDLPIRHLLIQVDINHTNGASNSVDAWIVKSY